MGASIPGPSRGGPSCLRDARGSLRARLPSLASVGRGCCGASHLLRGHVPHPGLLSYECIQLRIWLLEVASKAWPLLKMLVCGFRPSGERNAPLPRVFPTLCFCVEGSAPLFYLDTFLSHFSSQLRCHHLGKPSLAPYRMLMRDGPPAPPHTPSRMQCRGSSPCPRCLSPC